MVALRRDLAGFVTLAVTPSPEQRAAGWEQSVPVRGGESYVVRFRGQAEKLRGYAGLRLRFYDRSGQFLWETGGVPLAGDARWAEYAWRFRAPARATQAAVSLGVVGAAGGRAALDDLCFGLDDSPLVRPLIVDYTRVVGRVRNLLQVEAGCAAATTAGTVVVPVDVAAVFAGPGADPTLPESYDLAALDAALAEAASRGTRIMVSLYDGTEGGAERLPAEQWGEVARHLAMHYNDAWAWGYRHDIRDWEVRGRGEAEEDYERLAATIEALGSYDPTLRVGGTAVATTADIAYLEGLLAYLAERELSPGFISWRIDYADAPQGALRAVLRVEQLLARYGFGQAETAISAWAPPVGDTGYQVAHLAAAVSYWQSTGLGAVRRGCEAPSPLSERTWQELAQLAETPLRLATQGDDALGFTLLAGKSEDGGLVRLVMADTGSRCEEYRLALAHFPPGFHYTVREVSEGCPGEVIAEGDSRELVGDVLVMPWHAPAVHVIEVEW